MNESEKRLKYIKAYRRQLRREMDDMGYPHQERRGSIGKVKSSDLKTWIQA